MAQPATIRLEGDARKLLGEVERVNKRFTKMEQKLKDIKRGGKAAGDGMAKGFGNAALSVGKMALAFAGVNSAAAVLHRTMSLIRAEFDNIRQRRAEAAEANLTFEQIRRQVAGSLPKDITQKAFLAEVKRLAEDKGITQRDILSVSRPLLSSRGKLTQRQLFEALGVAATEIATTGTREGAAGVGGGALEILKAARPGLTGRQAVGAVTEFGVASNIDEIAKQALVAGRAVQVGKTIGFSPERSLELVAFTTQAGEKEGVPSVTGLSRLGATIDTLFGKGVLKSRGEKGLAELQDLIAGLGPVGGRAQAGFLGGLALGRAGPVRARNIQLLTRDPASAAELEAAERAISPVGPLSAAAREKVLGERGEGPGAPTFVAQQKFNAAIERQRLADRRLALAGQLEKDVPILLRGAGVGAATRAANVVRFAAASTGDVPALARRMLTRRIEEIEAARSTAVNDGTLASIITAKRGQSGVGTGTAALVDAVKALDEAVQNMAAAQERLNTAGADAGEALRKEQSNAHVPGSPGGG